MELLFKAILAVSLLLVIVFFIFLVYLTRTNRKLNFVLKYIETGNKEVFEEEPDGFENLKKHFKRLRLLVQIKKLANLIPVKRFLTEYFLTANIITVLGGAIFAVGIGYFVRYANYDDFINIIGRIIIAFIISMFLILFAHKLRHTHTAFSAILTGTGIGVLYFVFLSAYYNYNLFSEQLVFIILILITAFSVLLALFYDRSSLLLLSVTAAYSSPFLVSYNQSSPESLFLYLIILDVGVLAVVSFKKNMLLNYLAFVFTGVYFLMWFIPAIRAEDYGKYSMSFGYLTVFYILIFFIVTGYNIRKGVKFIPFELATVTTLNMLYYTAGNILLLALNPDYRGVFTAFVAIWNLLLLYMVLHIKQADKGIIYLLIGLSVIFLSLVPPVELVGKSVTIVWSVQIVLLMWISQRIDAKAMKLTSVGLALAMSAFVGSDMLELYKSISPYAPPKLPIINYDFIAGLMAIGGLSVNLYLLTRIKGKFFVGKITVKFIQIILVILSVSILYFNIYLEIYYHTAIRVESELGQKIVLGIYNFAFISALGIPTLFIKQRKIKLIGGIFLTASFFLYIAHYYFIIVQARNELLSVSGISPGEFWTHIGIIILVLILSLLAYFDMNAYFKTHKIWSQFTLLPLALIVLTVLSLETDNIWLVVNANDNVLLIEQLEKIHGIPYTLFWMLLSAVGIVFGTIFKFRQLRQVALFVVFVAVFKLFILDLAHTEPANKSIAFIGAGGILLFIAFIYQFNKKQNNETEH